MNKLYIVYNPITYEVYTIDENEPIAWTETNALAEIPYQEIDREKSYKFIDGELKEI